MWVVVIATFVTVALLSAADAQRVPRDVWSCVKLDRTVVVWALIASSVFWVLAPIVIYYWFYLRWAIGRYSRPMAQ